MSAMASTRKWLFAWRSETLEPHDRNNLKIRGLSRFHAVGTRVELLELSWVPGSKSVPVTMEPYKQKNKKNLLTLTLRFQPDTSKQEPPDSWDRAGERKPRNRRWLLKGFSCNTQHDGLLSSVNANPTLPHPRCQVSVPCL